MLRAFIKVLTLLMLGGTVLFAEPADKVVSAAMPAVISTTPAKKVTVVVVPVRDQISDPVHYILRRGLKEGVDVVVLDMNTPGGSAGTALEMMEALSKFAG